MQLECPKCGGDMPMRASRCPNPDCGFVVSVRTLAGHYGGKLRALVARTSRVACPICDGANPLKSAFCSNCRFPLSASAYIAFKLVPLRRWWDSLDRTDPRNRLKVQLAYLAFSALLLFLSILHAEKSLAGLWPGAIVLALVYVAFCTVFVLMVVPRSSFAAVARRASAWTKLALLLNYFTLILVMLVVLGHWQKRGWILAGTFLITLVGLWLFLKLIYPIWVQMGRIIHGAKPGYRYDQEQGRNVGNDFWGS